MMPADCMDSRRSRLGFAQLLLPVLVGTVLLLVGVAAANAQPNQSEPDTLVLMNGNQLTGKLLSVENGTVKFHTEALGDVSVSLAKVKSIHTSEPFVVIQQGHQLTRKTPRSSVPQGNLEIENKSVKIGQGSSAKVLPENQVQFLVNQPSFDKAMYGHHGWMNDWTGNLAAGLAVVEATQNSKTFTGSADLTRAVPSVDWMATRSRSTIGFSAAYGSVSSTNLPTVKTNIIHGAVEEDWFLTPRFFTLAIASWDHNFSQGLALQQIYGGGFGYTVLKTPVQELDLKTDLHFERQTFSATPGVIPPIVSPSKNLIGMDFGDAYQRTLVHGLKFNQTLMVTPSFNVARAFSALGTANLIFPVYKRFSFNLGLQDAFLNDPGFGSKKNSFQFTAGLGYSF